MPPKKRSAYTKSTNEAPAKRQKPSTSDVGKKCIDESGNPYWEIGGSLRRITVSEFKGNYLVSIREHYEKDGKVLPGKKGISLPIDQLNNILSILPQIDSHLAKKKINLTRPAYDDPSASASKDMEEDEEEEDEEVINEEDEEVAEEESDEEDEEEVKPKKKLAKGKKKKVDIKSEDE